MKKRLLRKITIMTVLAMVLATTTAMASTDVSRYTQKTYDHNDRFQNHVVSSGLDVSIYQGYIDWKKAKADGVDFAIVRVAGRGYGKLGTMYVDTRFKENLKNAKDAGVMLGVYFFSQAVNPLEAKAEARYIIKVLENAGYGPNDLDLPVFMDYEFSGGKNGRLTQARLTKSAATKVAAAFCEEVISKGYKPGIYANLNFLNKTIDGRSLGKKYPIWVAQYYTKCQYYGDYQWWQYSSIGKVDGVKGSNDCNFWYINPNPTSSVNSGNESSSSSTDGTTGGFIDIDGMIGDTEGQTPKKPTKSLVDGQAYLTGSNLYKYNSGESFKPTVSVNYQGTSLTENVDYKVRYINNTQAGTGYAMVLGLGDFADYKMVPFTVKAEDDLSGITVERIKNKRYTGKARKPASLKIRDKNGRLLTGKLDYTWKTTSATNVGTARTNITFKGNYTGTKTVTYKILKGEQEIRVKNDKQRAWVGETSYNLGVSLKFPEHKVHYSSSNPSVATVSENGTVTPLSGGLTDIVIKVEGSSNVKSKTRTIRLLVEKKHQKVTTPYTKYTREMGDNPFYLKGRTDGNGQITYFSHNPEIIAVDKEGKVTIVGVGTGKITVNAAATDECFQGEKLITVVVKNKSIEEEENPVTGPAENEDDRVSEEDFPYEETRKRRIIEGVKRTEMLDVALEQRGPKKVKMKWRKSKSGYAVEYYQVWKSTKKTSGFKKMHTTPNGKKKYYINTKGIKNGKTYWYKVRGVREVDGKRIYTPFAKVKITVE